MTRQNIGIGTTANDGSGDTLRQAGQKLKENFVELYQKLGGDSDVLSGAIDVTSDGLRFEGATIDGNETTLRARDPSQDNYVWIPDTSGELIIDSASQTLTNKTIVSSTLTLPKINDASADHTYNVLVSELTADREIALPVLNGNDTFVFADANQTLTNKTLTAPVLSTPSIDGHIADVNNAEVIEISAAVNAVNHIEIINAAAGADPEIHAHGADTNLNLHLSGKGTGSVVVEKETLGSVIQTSGGAADNTKSYIIANSGTAIAISLASGTEIGEFKIFSNRGAGTATITPGSFGSLTQVALAQYQSVSLIWDGNQWIVTGSYGATIT